MKPHAADFRLHVALLGWGLLLVAVPAQADVKAFPTAEGFGANSVGGRGGRVIEITNLNDSGPGSFRACAEASGPRICVFRVSGTIDLQRAIEIRQPYLTVAGHTSPGGVQLKGAGDDGVGILSPAHNIILRHLRVRLGGPAPPDVGHPIHLYGNTAETVHDVMVDHSSVIYNNYGGIDVSRQSANTLVYNNTLYNNDLWGVSLGGAMGGASIGTVVRNNIIYGSPTDIIYGNEYSMAQNPVVEHNYTSDPLFVNSTAADFHLYPGSSAINAGLTLPEVTTDFDGVRRPQGIGYDIGAYEFTVGGTLPGDLNKDGKRDLADVRLLIYMLIGQQVKTPEADLTGEGAVTLADLQALIRLLVGIS